MTFTLSGSVISQSGTDTSLAGLAGIAGVTTRAEGVSGISLRTTYILASTLRLVVSGTLSFNPALECLELYRNTDPILISGALVVGAETNRSSGIVQRSYHEAIRCYGRSADPWTINNAFHITGAVTLYGCVLITAAAISVTSGSLVIRDCRFYRLASLRSGFTTTAVQLTFSGSASADIVGLEDWVPGGFSINAAVSIAEASVNIVNLQGVKSIGSIIFDQLTSSSPRTYPGGIVKDLIPLETSRTIYAFSTPVRALNMQAFNTVAVTVANRSTFNSSPHLTAFVEAVRELNLTVLDSSGSPVLGALLYYRDVNNGNRSLSINNRNYVADFVYTANSNSSGLASLTVIEMAWYLTTYPGAEAQINIAPSSADLRISSDLTIRPFWASYANNIQGFGVQSGVLGAIAQSYRLVSDNSIVQSNSTTVSAYTGYAINTGTNTITLTDSSLDGARAYDYWKLWKVNNFSQEYPTVSSLICVKDGTTLDFGSINIVVNGVSWKSHASVTTIKTTGTITFTGGADYEVTVIDSSGTRYPAITISGFPTANNSNGIAPAPKVSLTNLRTGTTQAYTVSGATISLKLSAVGALPDDDVRITTDAVGYIRPLDQTVKGNRTEPVAFIFSPWLNSKGQEIVGLESAAAIDFDLIEEQLLLPTGVISFYAALMQWEAVTAGGSFYLFPTDAVRRFNFIEGFDGSKRVVVADPWTIAAKPDDASSPIISDFVVISQTLSRDPFEHGLASTASGLTDRPEVVVAFQNTGSSVAVTSIAANAITAASIASDAVAEIQSGLATASGLTTAQGVITTAIDAIPATDLTSVLDAVDAIPTNPVLATDSRLDHLDANISSRSEHSAADVWAVTERAITEKTGFSLTSTERTAIATAVEAALINEGDGQQLIDAILQVINSNLDLPALELTAIAQAVRTNLATELGRIDATISSRLADADYTAPTTPPTTAAIAAAVDASLLDNFAAIPTAPTASQNAAAVRTELSTELGRIDATINSRSTPAQVTAAQSAVQGSISALNNLSQTQAQSAATAALNAYDPPTKAELDSGLAALPALIDTALLDNFAAIISALPAAPDNAGIAAIKSKVDQITISSGKVSATLGGDPVVLPSDAVAKLTELWGLRGLDPTHPAVIEPLEQTYNGVTLTLVQSGSGQNAVVTITRS
jgi:hypothetical protein